MIEGLDQFALWTGLFGGLALFLLGMDTLTKALQQAAGDYMKILLSRVTSNRFLGLATGALITGVIQSSSVTTVLLVGFISAGLMSTAQSIAVILGANIGSTVTAQILAFKVTEIALPLVTVGFLFSFTTKNDRYRQYALIVLGLGLVFFGMNIMSDAVRPLRNERELFSYFVSSDALPVALLAGAVFTAVIQSSAATTGILIILAGQGLIGLEPAIAAALGANIGTCATAGLAAIGKPREAARAALAHTLFNVIGALLWLWFIPELAQIARTISPAHEELNGLARVAAETPRQIANIHSFFNIVNAFLFLGFTAHLTRLVEWIVPDRPLSEEERTMPRFLDDQLLSTPSIALDAARREIVRLGERVASMLATAAPLATSGKLTEIERLEEEDHIVDKLHREIVGYLRRLSLGTLSDSDSDKLMSLIRIANDIEHIGDQLSNTLTTSAKKRINEGIVVSAQTAKAIQKLHDKVLDAFNAAIKALDEEDNKQAKAVRNMKQEFSASIEEIARHEIARLQADEPKRLMTYAREIEFVEIFDDIFKTTRRIARTQIKAYPRTPEEKAEAEADDNGNGEAQPDEKAA